MKDFGKKSSKWLIYSSMGLELGLSVVVGFLIGSGLDKWLETERYLLIIFGFAEYTPLTSVQISICLTFNAAPKIDAV